MGFKFKVHGMFIKRKYQGHMKNTIIALQTHLICLKGYC